MNTKYGERELFYVMLVTDYVEDAHLSFSNLTPIKNSHYFLIFQKSALNVARRSSPRHQVQIIILITTRADNATLYAVPSQLTKLYTSDRTRRQIWWCRG